VSEKPDKTEVMYRTRQRETRQDRAESGTGYFGMQGKTELRAGKGRVETRTGQDMVTGQGHGTGWRQGQDKTLSP
jgi:hypothetical protein